MYNYAYFVSDVYRAQALELWAECSNTSWRKMIECSSGIFGAKALKRFVLLGCSADEEDSKVTTTSPARTGLHCSLPLSRRWPRDARNKCFRMPKQQLLQKIRSGLASCQHTHKSAVRERSVVLRVALHALHGSEISDQLLHHCWTLTI